MACGSALSSALEIRHRPLPRLIVLSSATVSDLPTFPRHRAHHRIASLVDRIEPRSTDCSYAQIGTYTPLLSPGLCSYRRTVGSRLHVYVGNRLLGNRCSLLHSAFYYVLRVYPIVGTGSAGPVGLVAATAGGDLGSLRPHRWQFPPSPLPARNLLRAAAGGRAWRL
jgi:hypothetical protein